MSDVLITTNDPFPIIKRAVNKSVDLVKPTYGPASNKVIISKVTHGMVVDDGVQIMRDLELPDANENAVLKIIKSVAITTNDRAGDGTTGSMIMLQSIVAQVDSLRRRDGHKIERELKKGLKEATEALITQAKPVKTLEDLKKVARVAFDNEEMANMIAETWHKVGKDGVVTLDMSPTMSTSAELSDGLSFKRGYVSPYMVTNPERMEAVVEKPYILITDYRLTEAADILGIMNALAAKEIRNLVVIAENIEQSALATAIINKVQNKFNLIAINTPQSDNPKVMLEDIALLTGAKVFSMDKGNKVDQAKIEDLGRADRFVAKRDSSVIIGPKGKKADIQRAIADLSTALHTAETEREKEGLRTRQALFSNKIAVIKVGAPTEQEQKALKYKVEDAVNAVRSAYKGGVVCGGGLALYRLETSSPLLNAALKAPHKQLLDNMGIEVERPLKDGEALNVMSGKIGKYLEVGVIDPVDVLVAGLESAVSIASILVTSSGMVVEKPRKIPQQ